MNDDVIKLSCWRRLRYCDGVWLFEICLCDDPIEDALCHCPFWGINSDSSCVILDIWMEIGKYIGIPLCLILSC